MDVKTIQEKSKSLVKATSLNESPSVLIGILNELKTGVVANEDLLRSTRIGVTVNKSKMHKNPEVARLASEIVRKWRDDIQRGKPSTPNGRKHTLTPDKTGSPAPSQEHAKKAKVAPAERSWRKDGIDVAKTGQATRDNCIGLIYDGLVPLSTATPSQILTIACSVEQAAYKLLGPEDREPYKSKVRALYQNLKNKSNPELRIRVVSGDIKPEKLISMSHDELKSEERRKEDEKLEAENMREAQVPKAEKSISTSLTCGKCGQKKVSYSQAQTRSADEPMTTFCECLNCGKRWKVCYASDINVAADPDSSPEFLQRSKHNPAMEKVTSKSSEEVELSSGKNQCFDLEKLEPADFAENENVDPQHSGDANCRDWASEVSCWPFFWYTYIASSFPANEGHAILTVSSKSSFSRSKYSSTVTSENPVYRLPFCVPTTTIVVPLNASSTCLVKELFVTMYTISST